MERVAAVIYWLEASFVVLPVLFSATAVLALEFSVGLAGVSVAAEASAVEAESIDWHFLLPWANPEIPTWQNVTTCCAHCVGDDWIAPRPSCLRDVRLGNQIEAEYRPGDPAKGEAWTTERGLAPPVQTETDGLASISFTQNSHLVAATESLCQIQGWRWRTCYTVKVSILDFLSRWGKIMDNDSRRW